MRARDLTQFEPLARTIEGICIPQIKMTRDCVVESLVHMRTVSPTIAARHFSQTSTEPEEFADRFEQATINLSFVQLYHLLEQQIAFFVRNKQPGLEYRQPEELLQAVFVHYGFDVTFFASWPAVEELRLIANTVKHAEAKDAEKLRQSNPKLFVHPSFDAEHAAPFVRSAGRQKFPAELAMTGEGFYPPLSAYEEKASAVVAFWEEFCAVIRGDKPKPKSLREYVFEHRDEILSLAAKYGASNVRVFGSVARGEAGPASDVDLLVKSDGKMGLFNLVALQNELSELLERKVDLGTDGGIKARHRDRILAEAVPL